MATEVTHSAFLITIEEISLAAQIVEEKAKTNFSSAGGLEVVARSVSECARRAYRRSRRLHGPLSVATLRLMVLLLAAAWFGWWIYTNYFPRREIRVAVLDGDSTLLQERVRQRGSLHVKLIPTRGSHEGVKFLEEGRAELAIVQGDTPIPRGVDVIGTVRTEHILYLKRKELPAPGSPINVITFNPGQGSHRVAKKFFRLWGYSTIHWLHVWKDIVRDSEFVVPDADAIFVVMDPADPGTRRALQRVIRRGYHVEDPYIGAMLDYMPYLQRTTVASGYYRVTDPIIPSEPLETYMVAAHLLASPNATGGERTEGLRALGVLTPTVTGSEKVQVPVLTNLADLFEAIGNVVIILAALFGLELLLHRRSLHELHNLISRISLLQSERDLFAIQDPSIRQENTLYLDLCADLLGLISALAGYYEQANAALIFNGLTSSIHSRADQLKINIQLKLVHGLLGK